MTWVRIDDDFPDHPKVTPLSDAAFRLHVTAMCYCGRLLTDGLIPRTMIARLAGTGDPSEILAELTRSGCWELAGVDYRIHDFLKYNPSAEQVRREREENAQRQAVFRMRKKGYIKEGSNAVSNGVTNGEVTGAPYPYPLVTKVTKEERVAIADAPPKPKKARAAKEPGLSHAPIHDAFDAAGQPRPIIETRPEKDAAQYLLRHFREHISEIPGCMDDIASGRYGGPYERRKLSLHLLATDNFLQNWLRWKLEGKPEMDSRPNPNVQRSPRYEPPAPVYVEA